MKFVKNPLCKNHANNCLHNTNHENPCKNHAKKCLHNSVDTENRPNFIRCKNHAKLYLHNSSHTRPNFLRKERTKSVRLFDRFILPSYIINIINQPRTKHVIRYSLSLFPHWIRSLQIYQSFRIKPVLFSKYYRLITTNPPTKEENVNQPNENLHNHNHTSGNRAYLPSRDLV